ncbi:MAG: DUF72 domain-containing protein [Anaerolineae bacterium]
MIYVGTSGYSYDDWIGPFYPPNLPQKEWLGFYAREFQTTELNVTYYRQPTRPMMERIAEKVPGGFRFTVKLNQKLTHEREATREDFQTFREGIEPLLEAGKLGCILAQFPWSFRPGAESWAYLQRLREELEDLPAVVEFRNAGWVQDETFEFLRREQLGFCSVDQPRLKGLMPPVAVATGPVAYVRFHGRNAAKWWQHEQAWERYDYTYSEPELLEWIPKIRRLDQEAQETYIFANNHWQGQAVSAARQLKLLLERPA